LKQEEEKMKVLIVVCFPYWEISVVLALGEIALSSSITGTR
jgi:hypothetical protein